MNIEPPKSLTLAVVTSVVVSSGITWAIQDAVYSVLRSDVEGISDQVGELRIQVSRLEWQCGRLRGFGQPNTGGKDEID